MKRCPLTFVLQNVYIRCLSDPDNCNRAAAKPVMFSISFGSRAFSFTLGPTKVPTLKEIGEWFADQLKGILQDFYMSLFGPVISYFTDPDDLEVEEIDTVYTTINPDDAVTRKEGDNTVPVTPFEGHYDKENSLGDVEVPNGMDGKEEKFETPSGIHPVLVTEVSSHHACSL